MSPASLSTERRNKERKRPLGLVYVELSAANGGMLRDLSEHGFAMRSMLPLRVGDASPFGFSLDPETRLEGQCKVLWVEEDGRVAGFQFTEVAASLPEKIRLWLLDHSYGAAPQTSVAAPVNREASTLEELREEMRAITPGIHDYKSAEEIAPAPAAEVRHLESQIPAVASEPPNPNHVEFARMELPHSFTAPSVVQEPVASPDPVTNFEPLPRLPELEVVREQGKAGRSIASVAVRMLIFLALVACAIVYHRALGNAVIWMGMKMGGSAAVEVTPAPVSEQAPLQTLPTAPAPTTTLIPGTNAPVGSGSDLKNKVTEPAPDKKNVEVPPVTENSTPAPMTAPPTNALVPLPATNRSTTFANPSPPTSEQPGQQEYQTAQEILKGRNPDAGLPEAVRLLWVAVEKGNSNAEVALAELYRHGTGVTKSCDQTSILLTAAARKGNAEAQKRLEEFQRQGCE
jgi:hypothetical protein